MGSSPHPITGQKLSQKRPEATNAGKGQIPEQQSHQKPCGEQQALREASHI